MRRIVIGMFIVMLCSGCAMQDKALRPQSHAIVEYSGDFTSFSKGEIIFDEKGSPIVQLQDVPLSFAGYKINIVTQNTNHPIKFEIVKAGYVFAMVDAEIRFFFDQDGWQEIDKATVITSKEVVYPMFIMQKYSSEGEATVVSQHELDREDLMSCIIWK